MVLHVESHNHTVIIILLWDLFWIHRYSAPNLHWTKVFHP